MKVAQKFFVHACVLAVVAFNSAVHASSSWVENSHPFGASILIPRNWDILSNKQRVTLDASVHEQLDLAKLPRHEVNTEFAANYFDDGGITRVMVNKYFYPDIEVTQSDVANASEGEMAGFNALLHEDISKASVAGGWKLIEWLGSNRENINGYSVVLTKYRRRAQTSPGVFFSLWFAD